LLYIQNLRIYFCGCVNIDANHKNDFFMFINDNCFIEWMEKLSKSINEIGKDLRLLINTNGVFENDDKPLDNQDVSRLLHVSHRTLQRYRTEGLLPFFKLGQKIYYRTSDVREFVYKNGDHWDIKRFDDTIPAK